jgi:hypothetical protein
MRKFILIAGIVLMYGTAHAAETDPGRSLSLASAKNGEKPVETPKADQPQKQADLPAATPSQADTKPSDGNNKPPEAKSGPTGHLSGTARPRHRQNGSIEARVIYELHRAGYYW